MPTTRKHDLSTNKETVNGIDRVDSKIGYYIDNCVTCCTMCNYMKQAHSKESFLEQVKKIYNHSLLNEGSTTTSNEGTLQVIGSGNGGHPNKGEEIV